MNRLKEILFLFVGVLLLSGSFVYGVFQYNFINSAKVADGKVTDFNAVGGARPQIEFTTADGEKISYTQSGILSGFYIGDNVKVLYNAENPSQAIINSSGALWFETVFLIIMGGVFVGVGLFFVISAHEN